MEIAIIAIVVLAALAAVLYPLVVRGQGDAGIRFTEAALNEQVERYREAIRRNTLCDRCLAANAAGSRYCAECGRNLKL